MYATTSRLVFFCVANSGIFLMVGAILIRYGIWRRQDPPRNPKPNPNTSLHIIFPVRKHLRFSGSLESQSVPAKSRIVISRVGFRWAMAVDPNEVRVTRALNLKHG